MQWDTCSLLHGNPLFPALLKVALSNPTNRWTSAHRLLGGCRSFLGGTAVCRRSLLENSNSQWFNQETGIRKGSQRRWVGTYNKSWLWVGVMLKDWLVLSKTLQASIPNVLFTCACASTMCNTLWAINQNAVATFHAIWFSTWPLRKGSFDSATIDFSTSWFLLIMLACFLRVSSCPASFPYVFRVGTAWNGDLWSFSGFTSLVPSASVAQVSWHFHLLGMREPELSRVQVRPLQTYGWFYYLCSR